jgi:hypothetical protein
MMRCADNDPADHRRHLVWEAIVVVDARRRESDLKALVREQKVAVPRLSKCGYAPRPAEDLRVIGGCSMAVSRIPVREP